MPHPLVVQLRFTRSEFRRGLKGLTDEDARKRIMPMNCISWNIGHLAWQEQRYWLQRAQDITLLPEINRLYEYGAEACTPGLNEMWDAWETITRAADSWLDSLTTEILQTGRTANGQPTNVTFGSMLRRTTYHYWYHLGENMAIRQMLGHGKLPDFVGNIDEKAPYVPE